MKNYELLYIVPNQYTEEEVKAIKEKVDTIIKNQNGIIGYENFIGKRKLAYPINKINHGYYLLTEFELEEGHKLIEISNFLRLNKEILRHQIITKKKITPEEIEKQKNQEKIKEENKNESLKNEDKILKEEDRIKEKTKKKETKNLDEKLDEIISGEDII